MQKISARNVEDKEIPQANNLSSSPINIPLRDYLAGQIVNGLLCNSDLLAKIKGDTSESDSMVTKTAYRLADCMIEFSKQTK